MSFFGKKTSREQAKAGGVAATGGQVDAIVLALIQALNDSDQGVSEALSEALRDIGVQQSALVISSALEFLKNNRKIAMQHRVVLLQTLVNTLERVKDEISEEQAVELVSFAVNDMVSSKDVVPAWQTAASGVLISVCQVYPKEVLDALLEKFPAGNVPHYFVLKSLADFAATNPMAFVPRITEVLSRILPILGQLRHENMRWVTAHAAQHLAEAVVVYVANIDRAEDKTIGLGNFCTEFFTLYEVMFGQWLTRGEQQVRLVTARAIGVCCPLLSTSQLEAQLPKIVQGLLAVFKREKESDRILVSQGLTAVFEAAIKTCPHVLEPLLAREVIPALFPGSPDTVGSHPNAIKNYNEVLRCFEILGRGFLDTLLDIILRQRLEQNNPQVRAGAMGVLKHFVTRLNDELNVRRPMIVSGVKAIVGDPNPIVRKGLSQLVMAMASQGYLSLEGGESLVEFVVRNSAISDAEMAQHKDLVAKGKAPRDIPSPNELRSMSMRMLDLMTTTIPDMEPILWPFLLETLVPARFTDALPIVAKCITHIAAQKKAADADDYLLDFDRLVNLPKPHAIIARLFVLLTSPPQRDQIGTRILELLLALDAVLHPSIPDLWPEKLPKAIAFLEANMHGDEWDQGRWEDAVLRILGETIDIVNDDEWNVALGEALQAQAGSYAPQAQAPQIDHNRKRQLYKFLGICMQKSANKMFVRKALDMLFTTTVHSVPIQRQGCAEGFGLAAAKHLDIVLDKLQSVVKNDMVPKSTGFMGMSKDKSPEDIDFMRCTLALCCGRVTEYGPKSLIPSRVDVHVLNNITPLLAEARSFPLRESIMTGIDHLAAAVHPDTLGDASYVLKPRDQYLDSIVQYMSPPDQGKPAPATPAMAKLRVAGLTTCSTLVFLPPALPEETESKLLSKCLAFFNSSTAPAGSSAEDEQVFAQSLVKLNELLASVLYVNPTVACLARLLRALEPWINHESDQLRQRALATGHYVLKKFVDFCKGQRRAGLPDLEASFVDIGPYMAMLVPRTVDKAAPVRDMAVRALQTLLYVDNMLRARSAGKELVVPESVQAMTDLRGRLVEDDTAEHFAVVKDLATYLGGLVHADELAGMLLAMMQALADPQNTSASGSAVVVNSIVRTRGPELLDKVPDLVQGMLAAMDAISHEQAMTGTLHTFRTLARHHLVPVVGELLKSELPHSDNVIKAFQMLARDPGLLEGMFQYLLEIVNRSQPYEEVVDQKKKGATVRTITHLPSSAIVALGNMCKVEEFASFAQEHSAPFVCSFLMRFGPVNGIGDGSPTQDAIVGLENLFKLLDAETVVAVLEDAGTREQLAGEDYFEAILALTAALCKRDTTQIETMHKFLFPVLNSTYPGQRVVATAMMAEFINFSKTREQLLQDLINCLLARLADTDEKVKLVALRGLGNVVEAGKAQVDRYSSSLLNALMTGMDDGAEVISMQAMNSLSRVFELVDQSMVSPVIVNLSLRLKPIFDKPTSSLRQAAFTLFGSLSRFGTGPCEQTFGEQIHASMTSVILHLQDEDQGVVEACKKTLRQICALLGSSELTAFTEGKVLDENRGMNFELFVQDLCKHLVRDFPERVNYYLGMSIDYYKSEWSVIRAAASMFTGYLIRATGSIMDPAARKNLSIDHTISSMIQLLKDSSKDVRSRAGLSLALCFDV